MDEQENVEHREAIVGLSLLGVLLLGLVGTIFYRIVNPSPPAKVSLESLVIAPEPGAPEPPLAVLAPALSPSESYRSDGQVNAATFGAEPAITPVDQEGPTFVAPTSQ